MEAKVILNFPNYFATLDGNILHYRDGCIKPMKAGISTKGYYQVTLCKSGNHYFKYVHRLILETFVGPCPEDMECLHLDENKKNNNLENLKWGTHSENVQRYNLSKRI